MPPSTDKHQVGEKRMSALKKKHQKEKFCWLAPGQSELGGLTGAQQLRVYLRCAPSSPEFASQSGQLCPRARATGSRKTRGASYTGADTGADIDADTGADTDVAISTLWSFHISDLDNPYTLQGRLDWRLI